jgi:calcineurin-like phosphoesterase family protein
MEKSTWFTSDLHFWHTNIIKYQRKGFGSVEEMNETLIQNWNSVVKPHDEIYILGDMFFCGVGKAQEIMGRLSGDKKLITGNHDRRMASSVKRMFSWVKDAYPLKVNHPKYKGIIELLHYPMAEWASSTHGRYHLFGHSHGKRPTANLSMDVGVDCWEYNPVHLDTILDTFEEKRESLKMMREAKESADPVMNAMGEVLEDLILMTPEDFKSRVQELKGE